MIETPHRRIRSFVRREGRMTAGQAKALEQLLPRLGIDIDRPLDWDAVFGRSAPRLVEIGFGSGSSLAALAAAHPECDYLGIEVHRPGVGSLLLRLQQEGLTNVRVACADAVEVLEKAVADCSVDGMYLFFPDPWHKTRHHKRRLVQPAFARLVATKLRPGGFMHMATDWEDYAQQMMAVMSGEHAFCNRYGEGRFAERGDRPLTKYEARGQRLGHGVWDLVFIRNGGNLPAT